jgi:uncharacterized protein YjbI with pentapeptide repeats
MRKITNGRACTGGSCMNSKQIQSILDAHQLWIDSGFKEGSQANFSGADLSFSELSGINLTEANFCYPDPLDIDTLKPAKLAAGNFKNCILNKAKLVGVDLTLADLSGAELNEAIFDFANLDGADFSASLLSHAHFYRATLIRTIMKEADLTRASLLDSPAIEADLTYANLSEADLTGVDFIGTKLNGANFSNAYVGACSFVDVNLTKIIGLNTVKHMGRSRIGFDTLYQSFDELPEEFLKGIGIPDVFLTYMSSLTKKALELYSCFISYSSKDQPFVERLHADLQNAGVRCWFAPQDLRVGDKIRPRIDESIRLHDKLLIVISRDSISSQWVEQEVETALAKEREQGRLVLFPIRLDDSVMEMKHGWPALIKNSRNIGDFKEWKNQDLYQKALKHLILNLASEEIKAAPNNSFNPTAR